MQSLSEQFIEIIESNPEWAFALVAAVAFLESMAVIGVLVPGWLMLVGIGSLIGTGLLPFYPMCAAMFLGAVAGEGISYTLGYYARDSIRHWRVLNAHQGTLNRADQLVADYGAVSLVIGRFIGPVRAILPVVVGIAGMSQRRFWLINIGSAIIWAPMYLIPGILLGTAISLPLEVTQVMVVYLAAMVVFVFFANRWWSEAKRLAAMSEPDNHHAPQIKLLRVRTILAVSCMFILSVVFLISPPGQQAAVSILQVLQRVG